MEKLKLLLGELHQALLSMNIACENDFKCIADMIDALKDFIPSQIIKPIEESIASISTAGEQKATIVLLEDLQNHYLPRKQGESSFYGDLVDYSNHFDRTNYQKIFVKDRIILSNFFKD
ncbi:hypothetical protein MJH12_20230 [bacterium]|nr:hypothetical protein [bacterium]